MPSKVIAGTRGAKRSGIEAPPVDADEVRKEVLGAVAIVEKLTRELRELSGSLAKDPEGVTPLVMLDLVEIEQTVDYLNHVIAVYGHCEVGLSLDVLSKGITPSALRKRIVADVKGLNRPDWFELRRDSDALAGGGLTRYEQVSREAGLHPWPAPPPLPSKGVRRNFDTQIWERYRQNEYRSLMVERPMLREQYGFPHGVREPEPPEVPDTELT